MGQRLLVVDSDRRFIQEHKEALEDAYQAEFLFATEGALTRLESGEFAAVLVCAETSEQKGYGLSIAIRRSPGLAGLKLAMISAKATEEEFARHRNTKGKADLYLFKPIASAALVERLAVLMPARTVDADNPLGDLGGPDLGDEWLESLKTELEPTSPRTSQAIALPASIEPVEPIAALDEVALADALPEVLEVPPAQTPAPAAAEGLDPLAWRIQDLEYRLGAKTEELDQKTREMIDLLHRHDAVTRNLDELDQVRAEAEALRQRLRLTEEQATSAASDLETARAEKAALQRRLDEEILLVAEKVGQNEQLVNTNAELQAQAQDTQRELTRLEAEAAEAREQGGRERAAREQAESERAGLEARLAEAGARLAEVESQGSAALAAAEAQARAAVEAAEALAASLRAELEDRASELTFAQERVTFQDAALQELEEARVRLQEERDRQDGLLADQSGEVVLLQERVSVLESAARAHDEEAQRLQANRDQLVATISGLEQQRTTLEANHERQQLELLAGIDEREAQIGRLTTTIDSQRERITTLEAAEAELQDRLSAVAAVLADLEGKARQALDLAKAPIA